MVYNSITESINNLAQQQRIRNRIDINRDIQLHVQKKANLKQAVVDGAVISIQTRTIADLEEERVTSMYDQCHMSDRIRMMVERDSVIEELFTEDNTNSDSLTETEII